MTVALPSPDCLAPPLTNTTQFDVRRANLGDGLDRIAEGGLNSTRQTYEATWVRMDEASAVAIYDALEATKGVEEITFTPPDRATQMSFTLVSLRKRYSDTQNEVVSAVLRQRFLP